MKVKFIDGDEIIMKTSTKHPQLYMSLKELFLQGDIYGVKSVQLSIDSNGDETLEVLLLRLQ